MNRLNRDDRRDQTEKRGEWTVSVANQWLLVSLVLSTKNPSFCPWHSLVPSIDIVLVSYSIYKQSMVQKLFSIPLSIEWIACSVFENGCRGDRSVRWIRSDCMCKPASLLNALLWEQPTALLMISDSFLFIHFFQSKTILLAIGFTWEMWKRLIALHFTSLLTAWLLLQIEYDSVHVWKDHCSPFAHRILWSLMQQWLF